MCMNRVMYLIPRPGWSVLSVVPAWRIVVFSTTVDEQTQQDILTCLEMVP